jgi:hypothetical protein
MQLTPPPLESFAEFIIPCKTIFQATRAAIFESSRIPSIKRSETFAVILSSRREFQQEDAMTNTIMTRTMRMASYALALTLVLGGVALARDDDDYYRQGNPAQARHYGYQNGYHDGARHGRHEGREHDPNDFQTPDWRQATRGYKNWMGPVDWYQRGYQEGYSNGFRDAYRNAAGWRDGDGDRDDRWSYGAWGGGNDVAYRFGYEDGSIAARGDLEEGKSYNSKPRGRFGDRDHGYRREYGSKNDYKAEYTDGYRAGYDSAFGNRY